MARYRTQKNLTISGEKLGVIIDKFGKMPVTQLAELIGESYQKTIVNIRLLELKQYKPKDTTISDENGCLDMDKFAKYYKY